MVLPDAVHDRGMAGIARGAMVKFSAEIDNLHGMPFSIRSGGLPATGGLRATLPPVGKDVQPASVAKARGC